MESAKEKIACAIASEIACSPRQAGSAIDLLDGGATVPFIARYRKEATGGLTDAQLRVLEERLASLRELEARRLVVISSIERQGKMTADLRGAIDAASDRQRLEDLYLPYRPKRRSRADKAREAGLEPLADELLGNFDLVPEETAAAYVAGCVESVRAALDGARDILAERFSTSADLMGELRDFVWKRGILVSEVVEEMKTGAGKYEDYFSTSEPLSRIPSHRALAMLRGRAEGMLSLRVALPEELEAEKPHPCHAIVARRFGIPLEGHAASAWLAGVCRWTWRVKCLTSLETEMLQRIKEDADRDAIAVFGSNLRDLLLAAPAGHKGVIGLDPGIRTGVKVAVISETGSVLEVGVVFPHPPRNDREGTMRSIAAMARRHGSRLVAVGNGTASRETMALVDELIARHPELGLARAAVSEAGASVYSASEAAAEEFPDMDVSYRGAVSIARRLQDPLAELVKIDPKAIGVGQYQHDVDQMGLARKLDSVVEDCVNSVGVDLNTASAMLLRRVAGMSAASAAEVVSWRNAHGAFRSRRNLLDVPRIGPRTFEQAAGFLRIPNAENPLDNSAVHPEAYGVARAMATAAGMPVEGLIGNSRALKSLRAADFVTGSFGLPTVIDIIRELEKPGRDPRGKFAAVKFDERVRDIADIKPGMELEAVISNVTAFGAFADIGVHQDGLIHVSEMADHFVKDPSAEVRVGQIVKVRVLDVDLRRRRISLSMKQAGSLRRSAPKEAPRRSAMAEALRKASIRQ